MTRLSIAISLVLSMGLLAATSAAGEEPFVYPKKGQSPEQTAQDRSECNTWAAGQTGFNPANPPAPPVAAAPPTTAPDGRRVRGAARGAAVGAVGGAIGGDAGKGAAAGAAAGAMVSGMKRRDQVRQAQASNDAALQAHQQMIAEKQATFGRAFAACLEARDYTVK